MTDDNDLERYYLLFNEIGIIEQLARSLLEAQLPAGLIAPHFNVLSHLSRVRDGQTPLRVATEAGDAALIRLLKDAGARR